MDAIRHAAFSEEVLRHVDRLYWFARLLARDPAWAEDLVQQTLLRAYEKADQLRAESNCQAWLFAILRNFYRMALRRQPEAQTTAEGAAGQSGPLEVEVKEELYPPPLTPEALVEQELSLEALEQAIGELPPLYREVLILADLQGLTYEEIAAVVECAVGTVKSRLYRARNRLRARLAADGLHKPLAKRMGR